VRFRNLLVREMVQMKIKISALLMEAGVSYNKQRLYQAGYFRELLATNLDIDEGLYSLLRLCRETVVRLGKTEKCHGALPGARLAVGKTCGAVDDHSCRRADHGADPGAGSGRCAAVLVDQESRQLRYWKSGMIRFTKTGFERHRRNRMRVRFRLLVVLVACGLLSRAELRAQGLPAGPPAKPNDVNVNTSALSPDVEVKISTEDGKALATRVVVHLINQNGQLYDKTSVRNGTARFSRVLRTKYRVLVSAPGYQSVEKPVDLNTALIVATVKVELLPLSDVENAAADRGISTMKPKAQKEIGKALGALRTNKPIKARPHLELARRAAPDSAELEYLFGVYASQINSPAEAQSHWNTALALNPNYLSALIEVGQELLNEKKAAEAVSYGDRAVEVEPSSWRAQALLAEAEYMRHNRDDAIKHGERAMELGHKRAASLEPFLAGMLAEAGEKERAIQLLQGYLKENPSDKVAAKQLERWTNSGGTEHGDTASVTEELKAITAAAAALPIPSNWMPPDVDENVPPVEPGTPCALDEVVRKAGDQLVTLVHNLDRFTATESIVDQTISKWGVASAADQRKFNYLVSIQELRPGFLSVEEYRNSRGPSAEFPDGVITRGLPALALVFHPYYAGNYEMTCEGLARFDGERAWQVHFLQRTDKPMVNRGFRVGLDMRATSHAAALKGRAWISAENYQIVRLETELVHPLPEIRLVSEHTAIEFGAVSFRDGKVNLWLPRNAEVYSDWKGVRIHRRHSFDNYLLFDVDENERIGSPKGQNAPAIPEPDEAKKPPNPII
jgi:tetratricopeptide (TPR) repeat protein